MTEDNRRFTSDFSTATQQPVVLVLKILALFALLYVFIVSINMMGGAFNLFGAEFSKTVFQVTSNPLVGLMIGVLATAIIQSSSTTTTMIVGLVAAGVSAEGGLSFEAAIPMVMGANIGTSVTNTIVSLGHITQGDEFKRAFGGAMLHDFFNICAVAVLLPIETMFHPIRYCARYAQEMFSGFGGVEFASPLAMISKPVAKQLIHFTGDSGWISLLLAFVLLILALRYMIKVLKSMVLARVEKFFQRYVFRTPALGFILGIAITVMVQSSSITTSMVVPLLGAGVITFGQIYPYLLGANIGTTITAFLASFVTGSSDAIAVAFAHLIFNIFGIMIFWPLKKLPIWMSIKMSEMTQKSKLVPIFYVIVVFFIIPGLVIYLMG